MSASLSSIPATVLRSLRWSLIATVGVAVLQLVYTAVMSRLLTPADFGLVGMAMVVISFGGYFAQMGLEQALIQRPTLEDEHIRAAFTVAISLGILVTGIVWLLAPVLAPLVFAEPRLIPVLRALSLTFFITSVGATALSMLRRQLRFNVLARIELSSFLVGYGLVGLGSAWLGKGIWSLVAATLVNQLLTGLLAWLVVRHSVRPATRWKHYRQLLNFGGTVSVVGFLEFVAANLDRIGIGRLLGSWTLGLYNRAFMLVHLPLYQLSNSISRVLLPSFSSLQHDLPRLRPLFLTALSLTAWLLLPLAAGTAVAAYPVVRVALGPQWLAAVPLLGPLALIVGINLLSVYSGILCESLAKLRFKLALQSAYVVLVGVGLVLVAPYGLQAAVLVLLALEVVRHLAYQVAVNRYLHIGPAELWRAYQPALLTAAGTAAVLYGARLGLVALHAGAALQLLVLLVLGAASLLGQLLLPWNHTIRTRLYHEINEHLPDTPLRPKLQRLLAPTVAGRRPRGWWPAAARVRVARWLQRVLLGPIGGRLPSSALRSVVEVCGWDTARPHIATLLTTGEPLVVHYHFPDHFPPYFRRYKAFGPQQAYVLHDVCVSPYSGLTWLPAMNCVLAESIGSVRRLSGWGNHVPELLLPVQPLAVEARPLLACPPAPFFHWVTEVLPNVLLALDRWPMLHMLLPPASACPAFMAQALAAVLGPQWEQRVVRVAGAVRVPELHLLPIEPDAGFVHPTAVRALRQALRHSLCRSQRLPERMLFISRRLATARQTPQEAELETALLALGVEVVRAEELDFAGQVRCFAQARVLIGMHGAGLTHMLWASRGLQILEVFPAGYFNDCYARLASTLGHSYSYFQADATGALPLAAIVRHAQHLLAPPVLELA